MAGPSQLHVVQPSLFGGQQVSCDITQRPQAGLDGPEGTQRRFALGTPLVVARRWSAWVVWIYRLQVDLVDR